MLDLHSARRSAEERERAEKSRGPRTVTLAAGARSEEESRILTALRKKPATSVDDLRSNIRINNDTSFLFAYNALLDRGMIRETAAGYFGVTQIVAVETFDD